jgi:hypothetical protein
MTDTVPLPFATYALPVTGSVVIPVGLAPTGMVAVTVYVATDAGVAATMGKPTPTITLIAATRNHTGLRRLLGFRWPAVGMGNIRIFHFPLAARRRWAFGQA